MNDLTILWVLVTFGAAAGSLWFLLEYKRPYRIKRDDHEVNLWDWWHK